MLRLDINSDIEEFVQMENDSQQTRYLLRLPVGLRDQIRAAAEQNRRSVNAEILVRLERGLEAKETNGAAA